MSLARRLPANTCYLFPQINSCLFQKNVLHFSFLETGRGSLVSLAHSVLRFFSYYSLDQV